MCAFEKMQKKDLDKDFLKWFKIQLSDDVPLSWLILEVQAKKFVAEQNTTSFVATDGLSIL